MIDGVRSLSGTRAAGAIEPRLPVAGPSLTAAERAAWGRPTAPASAPVLAQAVAVGSPRGPSARTHAALAADVYNDRASPPAGWRTGNAADLTRLGLTPTMLQSGDFRARVYATGSGADTHYVVAFRGTQSGGDWRANAQQGSGRPSLHYAQALGIGDALAKLPSARVTLTGHSLGGGLASATAIASGRSAHTFNAAGLHDGTIARARQINAASPTARSAHVDAWYVRGEILSFIQDGGDRAIGGLLGGLGGAYLADAPSAYGTRHRLDAERPDGVAWYADNRIARHGMDWVMANLPH